MAGRFPILALAALFAACASAPSRFYSLHAAATADGAPATPVSIRVGPVSVPTAVDRPEFVVQVSPNRVDIDEFNRWSGPLQEAIAQTVASDLSLLLATPDVISGPLANFSPEYRVTIKVQRFETVPEDSVLIEAMWVVRRTNGAKTRAGHTTAREAVAGADFDALPAAHSRALARMSRDLATAIRSLAREP